MEPTPEILDTTVIGQLKDEIIVLKERKLQLEMKIMEYETVADMAKKKSLCTLLKHTMMMLLATH